MSADIHLSETIERIRGQAVAAERAGRHRLEYRAPPPLASGTGGGGGKRRKTESSDYDRGGGSGGGCDPEVGRGTVPSPLLERGVLGTFSESPDPSTTQATQALRTDSSAAQSDQARESVD